MGPRVGDRPAAARLLDRCGARRPPPRGPAPVRAAAPAVRAWEGTLDLPTYEEGLPDVNPPFDVFETRASTIPTRCARTSPTGARCTRWRTLEPRERVPEGRSCCPTSAATSTAAWTRRTGPDLFYANGSIKKARVAYRGAWTALGIEFNFPVSHNWVTASPVDYALQRATRTAARPIWVGNQDRVYGMQWRVALTLRPGQARLEQDVALYNRSDTRHRFYWWNNAGVRVWDDSRIEYPMRFTASHGFREVDTWPVNQAGVDLTVVGNHKFGPVSEFSHGSREAVHGRLPPAHASRASCTTRRRSTRPTKKIWSWGSDPDGLDWRKALSDDESAYVEVQSGLFRNQETYAFLAPAGVDPLHRILDARARDRRHHAREPGGDAAPHAHGRAAGGVDLTVGAERDRGPARRHAAS